MAETLKRVVKSAKGKGSHSESSTTSEVTAPLLTTKDAGRSEKEAKEEKDENAFCVPWYLP